MLIGLCSAEGNTFGSNKSKDYLGIARAINYAMVGGGREIEQFSPSAAITLYAYIYAERMSHVGIYVVYAFSMKTP